MSAYHRDVTAALDFYVAVRDGNEVNQRQLLDSDASLPKGLLTLVGACLQMVAAKCGETEDDLIGELRAIYAFHDIVERL